MKRETLKRLTQAIVAGAPLMVREGLGLAGAGAVIYGTGLIYPPAGWILAGLMAMGVAFLLARAA